MTYLVPSPPRANGLRPNASAYARGLGTSTVLSVASAAPVVGSAIGALTSIGSALGIGGATDQQKSATRVARANELYTCALRGDVGAAQRLLYGAGLFGAPGSGEPASLAQYKQNVAQLQATMPSVYSAAVQGGPVPDTTGKGCISINSTTGAPIATPTTGSVLASSLGGNTGLIVLGVLAAIGIALSSRGGKRRTA